MRKKDYLTKKILISLIISGMLLAAGCQSATKTNESSSATSAEVKGSVGASANAKIKEGGELVFGLSTQPDHLDPYLASTADTRKILFNIFEGLVKPDKDGNLIPAVAESYTISEDGLSYTFKIRDGIKFHNGNKVTVEDVKYSVYTAAGLPGGKPLVNGFENIKSVDTIDTSTVRINLKQADYDFLPYLTAAIIPKDYKDQNKNPIGTGPFKFESFKPQESLTMKKNPDYWQNGLPHLDKLTFKLEPDSNAITLNLQGGSIDCTSIANNLASQLGQDFNIIQSNFNAVQLLALNNAVKPFDNTKVRQALSYIVDPDEIIQTVNFGKGVRSGTPIIPGLKKYFDDSLTNAYVKNIDKAKQLLSEAGYPNGFSFTITVPSNYTVHVDTAQVIINELAQVGIKASIKQVDFATWLSEVYTNRQYEATVISVDGVTLSPKSYLGRYVSTASDNFVNYKNKEYDDLYNKAVNEPDENKRITLYKQAQQLLSKDAASVYIEDIANLTALRKGLDGYVAYPLYVVDASTIYYTK